MAEAMTLRELLIEGGVSGDDVTRLGSVASRLVADLTPEDLAEVAERCGSADPGPLREAMRELRGRQIVSPMRGQFSTRTRAGDSRE